MFWFNKTVIRELTVCASLKLQYWRRLKCFIIELFGRVAAPESVVELIGRSLNLNVDLFT
jgi:hypothetical protein